MNETVIPAMPGMMNRRPFCTLSYNATESPASTVSAGSTAQARSRRTRPRRAPSRPRAASTASRRATHRVSRRRAHHAEATCQLRRDQDGRSLPWTTCQSVLCVSRHHNDAFSHTEVRRGARRGPAEQPAPRRRNLAQSEASGWAAARRDDGVAPNEPRTAAPARATGTRLAELICVLSLSTDLALGQPMEHVLRSCLIAQRLAQRMGLDEAERCETYWVTLLATVCTGESFELVHLFGDDIAFRTGMY